MRRGRWMPVLVAAAVTLLAGCTGDDAASSESTRPAEAATPGGNASPTPTATPEPLTGLVAGRTIDDRQGRKITVTPVTLKRQGKLVLLELAARNEDPSERANLADSLRGDGTRFDGVTLLDPAGAKRYLVARDSQDSCLCSSFVGGINLQPGGTGIVSAYFAAPPENVTALNVVLPLVGTFTNVPVSS